MGTTSTKELIKNSCYNIITETQTQIESATRRVRYSDIFDQGYGIW